LCNLIPYYLFVYGTLMRRLSHPAHRLLARRAEYISDGIWQGMLFDTGSYPVAVPSTDPHETVHGEVYRLESANMARVLAELDVYEDCDAEQPERGLYQRQIADVKLTGGTVIKAWIYVYNGPTDGLTPIPSGNYGTYFLG
jgi:gamma-glutamylcyclotransferase (GGCT)/AIG2-like uncharacterized protein YtfP